MLAGRYWLVVVRYIATVRLGREEGQVSGTSRRMSFARSTSGRMRRPDAGHINESEYPAILTVK